MKGKQIDSITRAKIIQDKITNPHRTNVDIAKEYWIDDKSVFNILKDIPNISEKSQAIADLIDRNNTLLQLTDAELVCRLWKEEDRGDINATELVRIRESAFKQNQLLTWWSTDNIKQEWIAEDAKAEDYKKIEDRIDQMKPEELNSTLNDLLN